ncbi:MAG: hypothetical protein JRN21_04795 [Nitrososphaerota archaeon]|nr:hypothetical protein [Nitrososphaerota archaeon]
MLNATEVPGVVGYSPEVFAPAVLDGRIVVVRGVNLTDFATVQPLAAVSGTLAEGGSGAVYVGDVLARSLGLAPGASLTLEGVLASSSFKVSVAGVFSAPLPFSDEVLSTLGVAQGLRGLSSGQVTFVRLKVDPAVFNRTQLVRALEAKPSGGASGATNPFLQQLQLAPTTTLVSLFPSGIAPPSLTAALDRGLGLEQAVFESLGAVVVGVSLLAVYFATSYWYDGVEPTLKSLGALGMSRGKAFAWLLAVAAPASILAGGAGCLAAYGALQLLSASGSLQFFFQPLPVALQAAPALFSSLVPAAAVVASLAVRARRGAWG